MAEKTFREWADEAVERIMSNPQAENLEEALGVDGDKGKIIDWYLKSKGWDELFCECLNESNSIEEAMYFIFSITSMHEKAKRGNKE